MTIARQASEQNAWLGLTLWIGLDIEHGLKKFFENSHLSHSVPSLKAIIPIYVCWLRGLVAALCLSAGLPALAQRVQFPSMVEEDGNATSPPLSPITPPPSFTPPPTYSPAPATGGTFSPPPSSGTFDPYAAPLAQPATQTPFSPYGAPAPYYSPTAPSPYSPTPQALYPDGVQLPQVFPPGVPSFGQPMRFLQEVRGRGTWLSDHGSNGLGVTDVETSATFAIPFFRTSAPLLVTPGFGIHYFQGPITTPTQPADLPANTYEGFVDGGWHPQVTPWLGANLGVRVGAYTDFNTFNTHSIRIMGRGLAIITFTPTLQFAAGVVYIDRNLIKLLPAGGVIWMPNPDARYEFLFPNPKLAHRWRTLGTTDVWFYASGEYGGGAWTVQRADGSSDDIDYNDIRVNLGIESFGHSGLHGWFEVGYVFQRQIVYRSATPQFDPSDTIMLRAGLAY